jgi:hypothetical protein
MKTVINFKETLVRESNAMHLPPRMRKRLVEGFKTNTNRIRTFKAVLLMLLLIPLSTYAKKPEESHKFNTKKYEYKLANEIMREVRFALNFNTIAENNQTTLYIHFYVQEDGCIKINAVRGNHPELVASVIQILETSNMDAPVELAGTYYKLPIVYSRLTK